MTIQELFEILLEDKPSTKLREQKEELFKLIPELKKCDGFDQHSKWHPYDVLEHIFHVVDNVDPTIELRLAALFHDVAKPDTFELDEEGKGHFPNHGKKSVEVFNKFSGKYKISKKQINIIDRLIKCHDDYLYDSRNTGKLKCVFSKDEIELLYEIQKADLLAQSKEYHYLLDDYKIGKEKILLSYEGGKENEYHI